MKSLYSILLIVLTAFSASAQWGVKTNLLYDATTTLNLGAEVGVAPKWSIDLSGNLNPWKLPDDKRIKHWLLQPEVRYWLCNRFAGHFFAAHLIGGQYNMNGYSLDKLNFLGADDQFPMKDYRLQGWMAGAGLAYGYTWILNRRWSIEAEIGFGWVYTGYDAYRCSNCGKKVGPNRHRNYVGPTKAAVNLIYVF